MSDGEKSWHPHPHAFADLNPLEREGLVVAGRRNMLKAGMAGLAGLSLPDLLRCRARASEAGNPIRGNKSVILLWMAGGPSQIDTWDPKPDRPLQNRGPFGVIPTKLPGVLLCEHLPKQAAMLDKFTILRSVDCRYSNHEPNKVFQTANLEAEPRINPGRGHVPGHRLDHSCQAPRGEPSGDAALRGVPDLPEPRRLRRASGPQPRPVHRQRGDPAADLYQRRRGHRPIDRGRLLQTPGGTDPGAAPRPPGGSRGPRPPPSRDRPFRAHRGDGPPRSGRGGDAGRSTG